MKLFTCMCCTALFNMLMGMAPKQKQQQQDHKAQAAYNVYIDMTLDDLLDAVNEKRVPDIQAAKLVVQAKFLADSLKLERRLDRKSEVDPNFGTSDILIDPETIARYQGHITSMSDSALLDKKNQ